MNNTHHESEKESSKNSCTSMEHHHCCGHHFWFWAIIRITIVVGFIVGAFFVGILCRIDAPYQLGQNYKIDYGHRGMMNPINITNPPRDSMMEHCQSNPTMKGCQNYISKNGTGIPHSMMSMSMKDMATMLEGKTGDDLDRAFLEGMIPHHQGAVDMARYLTGAKHPELKKMGQDIITSQNKEIEQMKKWQKEWGYTTGSTNSGNPPQRLMIR